MDLLPQFSIGIPAFKATYLDECISSIINQTYSNWELIIVNDASPEPLDDIVSKYISDKRIRYFKNDNNIGAEHVVDNWNICLEKSVGEFFLLMGDDDVLKSDFLIEFKKLSESYPDLDVYHCRSLIIDENSQCVSVTPRLPDFESVYDNILQRMNSRPNYISDFVFRRNVLVSNKGFFKLPLAWSSDDITSFIAAGNKGIAHTNNPVFCYRKSGITISSSGSIHLKINAIAQQEQWYEEFLSNAPSDEIDLLVFNQIKNKVKLYFKRRLIHTITNSYDGGISKNLSFWFRNKGKYKLSNADIGYSLLEFIKKRKKKQVIES